MWRDSGLDARDSSGRQSSGQEARQSVLDAGDELYFDPASRIMEWQGARIRLTPSQAAAMILMIRNAPRPVSVDAICETVRGYLPVRETSAVRVLMHRLREG